MRDLNDITIADLMPESISGDAQVSATAQAIDPQLRLISEAVDKPIILASIDELSPVVLEHLAVQYDVTSWDSAWPIATKRAVLKTAIADKRKKGTRGSVERAIEAVGQTTALTEWWQDASGEMPPHTFKIDLLQDGSAVDPEIQENVIAQVNEAKPVRSHYTFTTIQQMGSGFYFAGVLRAISYARVRPDPPPEPEPEATPAYYVLTSIAAVQGPPLGKTHLVLGRSARGSRSLSIAQGGAARVLQDRYDTSTGTISSLTLPTAHNGSYTDVTFESLRYYAKGTVSNIGQLSRTLWGNATTWYYGVLTWTDNSLEDLTGKIALTEITDAQISPQSVFRILFICSGKITGYYPNDTSSTFYGGFIRNYGYNNGTHSIEFWSPSYNWTTLVYTGRIMFRYLDETTTFKNLSAFDLIHATGGVLSKETSTDRYDMYSEWNGDITIKALY